MLTEEELLEELRRRHKQVGGIEEHGGQRFVYIDGMPVRYKNAYESVAGLGSYEDGETGS